MDDPTMLTVVYALDATHRMEIQPGWPISEAQAAAWRNLTDPCETPPLLAHVSRQWRVRDEIAHPLTTLAERLMPPPSTSRLAHATATTPAPRAPSSALS